MNRLIAVPHLILLGSLALTACPAAPPPDPLPPAPKVVRFVASPTTVARGALVSLKWETENAGTIEIVDLNRGAIAGVADQVAGDVQVPVTQSTVFVISARNSRGARASSVVSVNVEGVEAAAIVFTGYPPVLLPGKPGLLVWNAPNARQVKIRGPIGPDLDLRGQVTSGSVEVDFSTDEAKYVLNADGVTREVTLVRGQAISEFLTSKPQVQAGDQVTLTWKALNASRVRVTSPGRGVLKETTVAAEIAAGTFVDTLGAQLEGSAVNYVLEAEGKGPLQSKIVTVYYGTAPKVLTATAPRYVKENTSFTLAWTSVGADRVEVRNGQAIVYRTPGGTAVATGTVSIPAPAAVTDYVVAAISSPSGASDTRTVTVTPVTDVLTPTLTAAPTTIAAGGTPVTLTWSAPGAVRARIVENDEVTVLALEGTAAASGTVTVYPNKATTTYELRAGNTLEANVTAAANVTVTTPATVAAADGGTIYQSQGTAQLAWSVGGATSRLVGFGTPTAEFTASSTGFTDISTTGTELAFPAAANDAIVSFTPIDFETFLGSRRVEAPVSVSTNGFLQFVQTPPTNSRPVPAVIPSATATTVPEDFLAPYWADLELGTGGKVFWQLVGTAPNRELVVQWNNVRVRAQATSALTFQARVHQAGAVRFEYQTVNVATAVPVTIGYQGPIGLGYAALVSATATDGGVGTTGPTSTSSYTFAGALASPALVSTLAAPATASIQLGSGNLRLLFDAIVKPTDISVSEVMNRPNPAVPSGQWVELANFSNATIELSGWAIGTPADGGTVQGLIPNGLLLPPRGFLVVGTSADPDQNDGLPSGTVAAPGLSLSPTGGTVRFSNTQGFIGDLTYGAASVGISLAVDRGPFVNRGALATAPFTSGLCPSRSSQTYGNLSPSQRGSPGAINDGACIGYTVATIPVRFKDIATTGTLLNLSSLDDSTVIVDISSNPINTFGVSSSTLTISTNGWLVPKNYTGDSALGNKVAPNTSAPDVGGVIAPFWDDLRFLATRAGSGLLLQRFDANADVTEPRPHWIVQWNRIEGYVQNDDMTFQVKLFDNGDLEYHYATMINGSTANRATGNSATVWLEENIAAPTRALVSSINQPAIRPNSALRFTRVP